MRSQWNPSVRAPRRPEYVGLTVMAAQSVPLWCQGRTTAWQALMRSRLMADEPVQVLRRLLPTEQSGCVDG